jgi:hypothetical protein
MNRWTVRIGAWLCGVVAAFQVSAQALQGTAFTYQGELVQNAMPVEGSVDLVFELFDAPTGGQQVGPALAFTTANGNPVAVSGGLFAVALDFGAAAFAGPAANARWLRVTVNGNVLAPRTKIENAPYALLARNAELAFAVPAASIGADEVVATEIQLRGLSTTCGEGEFVRAIGADGDVLCAVGDASSGTITEVAAGFGLSGGGTTGAVSLAVDPTVVQRRGAVTSCAIGLVARGISAAGDLDCVADASASGDITGVTAGTGLTGGGASGDVSLAVNTTVVQARVQSTCAIGSSIRQIGVDGTVTCQADANSGGDITGVAAGTGLVGGATAGDATLAADTNVVQSRVASSCAAESSIRQINTDGSVVCEADSFGATGTGWSLTGNAGTVAGTNYLGTTDAVALELKVQGARALRIEPTAQTPFSGQVNVIGGAAANTVTAGAQAVTIAGGGSGDSLGLNSVTDSFGVIGGGVNNRAGNSSGSIGDATAATVGGGSSNVASGSSSTVAGGSNNNASGTQAFVAGGQSNIAEGTRSAVGGGVNNFALGTNAVVAGGNGNSAAGINTSVTGGGANGASGTNAVVAGGNSNLASGFAAGVLGGTSNAASGALSTAIGGASNVAGGDFSFASGRRASVRTLDQTGESVDCLNTTTCGDEGTVMFADSNSAAFFSDGPNKFLVRATGGTRFVSAIDGSGNATAGVELFAGGGSWSTLSDRNAKTAFAAIDPLAILDAVLGLPIAQWSYRAQSSAVRHVGPMAQDFHAAFGLGEDARRISTVDADGVALAAIQGLNARLEAEVATLAAENARLEARLARLEAAVRERSQ